MNKSTVIDWILTQNNVDSLRPISEAIKDRKQTLSSKLKYELKPGMSVNVNGSNKFDEGVVVKVNKTRAVLNVDINGQTYGYNVPFSMISTKEEK
jgi:FKBP-type peptidyl-prolyl cis-trans isomerase 2